MLEVVQAAVLVRAWVQLVTEEVVHQEEVACRAKEEVEKVEFVVICPSSVVASTHL